MSTSNDWLFGNSDARISHRKTESFFADVIARAHEWDLSTGTVVSIYGAGGEGKSFFIRELRELCKNRLPSDLWSTVYIDFFKEKSLPIEDLRSMFEAFAAAGIFCPRFDVAYHSYQHPGNMARASAGYLQDCQDYIEDTAILSEVSGPMNTFLGVTSIACDLTGLIPGVSTLKDAVELYFDKRDELKRNREREVAEQLWRDYANYDSRSLIACMPRLLLEDFTEAIDQMSRRTTPYRPAVIVDTFEHLLVEDAAGTLSSIGEVIQSLSHVPNMLPCAAQGTFRTVTPHSGQPTRKASQRTYTLAPARSQHLHRRSPLPSSYLVAFLPHFPHLQPCGLYGLASITTARRSSSMIVRLLFGYRNPNRNVACHLLFHRKPTHTSWRRAVYVSFSSGIQLKS